MTHSLLVNPVHQAHQQLLGLLNTTGADSALFERMSLPSTKDEDWKYTRLSALWKTDFQSVALSHVGDLPVLASHPDWYALGTVICFVDGVFSAEHSTPEQDWQVGITLSVSESTSDVADALHALARASVTAGASIAIQTNQQIEKPIILLSIGQMHNALHSLRHQVKVGSNSSVTLIETCVSAEAQLALSQLDIEVAQNAQCTHLLWQDGEDSAFSFGWRSASLARDARFVQRSLLLGNLISRQQWFVDITGENAESDMASGVLGVGNQTQDLRTHTRHATSNARSRQWHRFALTDQANGVFHGDIKVERGADKTDADMATHNLLLSPKAQANSKPQLEIYADDVRCTHGVTSGFVDEAQVFYLRARGIPEAQAKLMISAAFAQAALADVSVPEVAEAWQRVIADRLA